MADFPYSAAQKESLELHTITLQPYPSMIPNSSLTHIEQAEEKEWHCVSIHRRELPTPSLKQEFLAWLDLRAAVKSSYTPKCTSMGELRQIKSKVIKCVQETQEGLGP